MRSGSFFSKGLVIALICICFLSVIGVIVFDPLNQDKAVFELEPSISHLKGNLITRLYYGAPNYGENPESDDKEYPFILQLDEPIEVHVSSENDKLTIIETSEIQLVSMSDEHFKFLKSHKNERIEVSGELFEAFTGHHHTNVLLVIDDIN